MARQRASLLAVLLAATAASWAFVVAQAGRDVGMHPGGLGLTMGMRGPAFVVMWTAMMAGMMFPASAPMILMFSTMQQRKRAAGRPSVPVFVFVSSYMAVWATFGVIIFFAALGADRLAAGSPWLTTNWPRLAGGLLVAAGLYQLSPLKDVCLGKCRSPFSFLLTNWRDGAVGAFQVGLRHGVYCVGCCWMLFVILVPLGVMNLAAMAAITLVVFAEKVLPAARWTARVAASGLVAYGAIVLAVPSALPGGM